MSTTGQPKASRLELALAVAALAFAAWFFACIVNFARDAAADDAFISYTYGRNLSQGHGLRYNASDAAPTAGASSTLHVLFIAAALKLGLDPLMATRALGIACLLAIAVVFGLTGARLARAPPVSGVLAGITVVFLFSLVSETEVHLASGMETLLFTATHAFCAAWAACVVFNERERLPFASLAGGVVALALLLLARPEGGLLGAGYLAAVVAARASRGGAMAQLKSMRGIVVLFALGVAALLAWRQLYFGRVLANPYYVKSHNAIFGSDGALLPGFDTTWHVLAIRFVPLAALGALLAAALGAPREVVRKALWLLAPAAAVVVLYARAIHEMSGGFRYEYPMLAPFLGALIVGLCALRRRSAAQFGATLATAAIALPLLAAPVTPPIFIWLAHARSSATVWAGAKVPQNNALERLGLDLRDTGLAQDASIVLSAAGQIPWHSRMRAIDWIGLNNNEFCGREALSIDELWQRIEGEHPDVVMSILPPAAPGSSAAVSDVNFSSANVKRTLGGRGSALFERWNQARVAESFWREMRFIRDGYEFGACYKMGTAWGDDWWTFAYVRRDSPRREKLLDVFGKSMRTDRTSDLSSVFPFDPRKLGAR